MSLKNKLSPEARGEDTLLSQTVTKALCAEKVFMHLPSTNFVRAMSCAKDRRNQALETGYLPLRDCVKMFQDSLKGKQNF
jgi:hypothetical protein